MEGIKTNIAGFPLQAQLIGVLIGIARAVDVLSGVGRFTVGGTAHICKAGDVLVMPAKIPHAVYAEEDFKWILTVVFPLGKENHP